MKQPHNAPARVPARIPVRAAGQPDEVEILLYGEIGWECPAKDFVTALGQITAGTIHLHINSEGGDVFEGVAIFSALRNHAARIVVHIDGLAASIASLVAMVGDEVRMAENGFLMVHNSSTFTYGDAAAHRRRAELLDKVDLNTLIAAYRGKTGASEQQVRDWMDAETWFSAAEAKEAGFVDEVETDEDEALAALGRLDLSTYRHVPPALAARAAEPSKREVERRLRDAGFSRTRAAAGAAAAMHILDDQRDAGRETLTVLKRLTTILES